MRNAGKILFAALAIFFAFASCRSAASDIRRLGKKAYIDPMVTVLVLSKHKPRSVRLSTKSKPGLTVTIGPDRVQASACGVSLIGDYIGVRCGGAESQKFRSAVFEDINGDITVEIKGAVSRRYRGKIFIEADETSLKIVNQLPLEEYLISVVGNELDSDKYEAMKAQAIVARTVAIRNRGSHGVIDFCDLTHCQDYNGIEGETKRSAEAVKLTRGQIITYKGRPAELYYHSTCGGHTVPPDPAWGLKKLADAPHLAGVDDEGFCSASPHYRWSVMLTSAQLRQLEIEGLQGVLADIRIKEKTADGHVATLQIITSTGLTDMSGYDFYLLAGRTLGWNVVKSTAFDVTFKRGRLTIVGRGLGHGTGMCQWGAMGLASKGFKFKKILSHYFPGTEVQVWQGDAPSRD